MATMIYLHGFASMGEGPKAEKLRAGFPNWTVLSPTLSMSPEQAVNDIGVMIQDLAHMGEYAFYLVGTSMGGLLAHILAEKWDIPAFIINPTTPDSMRKRIGDHVRFDGTPFSFTNEDVAFLEDHFTRVFPGHLLECVVSRDDDVVEWEPTTHRYHTTVLDGYGHRFDGVEDIFPLIRHHMERWLLPVTVPPVAGHNPA